jgi:hypothetical protein
MLMHRYLSLSRPLTFIGLLLAFGTSQAFADISAVSVLPSTLNVGVGQSFSLNISIPNAADLYAFQFDLGFSPTILSATSISEGPFLPTGGATLFLPGTIDNNGGTISFNADTLLGPTSGVNGNGVLATVDFTALATGTSPINLFNVTLLDSNLTGIDFTTTDGAVNVRELSVTPEIPTSLMFLTGVVLFAVFVNRDALLIRLAKMSK